MRPLVLSMTFLGCMARLGALQAAETPDPAELEQLMRQEVNQAERMNATVTSVGRHSQKLSETAAAVYVLTQKDIRRSGATTIPDALRMVPGLDVARIDSNKWAVGARGFNGRYANKLLVLVDGREVYNPTFAGVYWEVQNTPLYDIDRIEIIRGPGASLWGANAVNGVINIITKSAGETVGGRLVGGAGTYEKGFGSLRYGLQLGENTAGRVWGQGFSRGSFDTAEGGNNHDSWDISSGGFRLDHDAQRGNTWMLEGDAYSGTLNQTLILPSPFAPYNVAYRNAASVSGFSLLGRWKTATSLTSEATLQAYYDHSYRNETFLTQERDTFDLDFQHRFVWWDRHNVNWGLGYRVSRDRFGNTEFASLRDTETAKQLFGGFLQDDITVIENTLTLTLGSKLQHNDFTGFEVQPSIRAAFTPDSWNVFWASISRAVRIPSRFENNGQLRGGLVPPNSEFNPSPYPGFTIPVGGPQYQAEKLLAYELGYRFKPDLDISLDVALFYNDYTQARGIDFSSPSTQFHAGENPYYDGDGTIANSMKAQSYGMEWLLNWKPFYWWTAELAYSYIKTDFQSLRGPRNFSSENGYNPQHQLSFRSSFQPAETIDLDFWYRYVDDLPLNPLATSVVREKVPGYSTMDARLAWRPINGLEVSITGQNLLEGRHVEFEQEALSPPRTSVPRSVYFKLDWRF